MKSVKCLLSVIVLFSAFTVFGQSNSGKTKKDELDKLSTTLRERRKASLAAAVKKAKEQGLPMRQESENGQVVEIQGLNALGDFIYYITDNLDAARTVGTDKVWPLGGLGYSLSGDSMTVGEWDGGAVRQTHHEMVGQVTQVDGAVALSDHATHVAGTLVGLGTDSSARGMAYTAKLDANDWNFDDAEMTTAAAGGLLVSNHSYGTITGWRYNSAVPRWEWWGNPTISAVEDYRFGFYDFSAQAWDQIAHDAPFYLIVKSAGNDRGDSHTGSHYLPNGGGITSTAVRDDDGGTTGYDCISTNGNAKNILTVGAVNAIPNGYTGTSDVVMSSFSGWGPTDDGRIKPDIVANGVGVYSSLATHDSAYAFYNGTSMAAPNTTGSLTLIQQHYKNVHGHHMLAATLKSLVIHTAEEAGAADGPDYEFGWGLLSTDGAVEHITNASSRDQIIETSLSNAQTYDLIVTSDGLSPLRATISWTDEPGTPPPASLDPVTIMLVNDLDLRIINGPTTYLPYILDPASPATAATKADNIRDNVEQVYIAAPPAGTYTIRVTHKGTLFSSLDQDFSLIVSGGVLSTTPLTCGNVIGTFPYEENFETFTNCSTTPGDPCPLPALSGWENASGDSLDWTTYNGSTPTASTGPAMDQNPGTAAGKYLYIESTGIGSPSQQAILVSPCIDVNIIAPELTFAYFMEGTDMGSLSVDVNSGVSWTNVWFTSGDQGSGWKTGQVNLSDYEGDTIQIRFRGVTGAGGLSDIAIDAVKIAENPYNCTQTVSTFPYNEDFETFANCSTNPATACLLPTGSGWVNESGDDIDWTTDAGGTTSSNTGPTEDYNPGTVTGKYLYTEATGNTVGFPSKEAILSGPCFNLSSLKSPEFSFAYHMYGGDQGDLYVEVDSGAGFNIEYTLSGDQGNNWYKAQVDLTAYTDKTVHVRFRGVTGLGFESDIAIDDIRMGGPTPKIYCVSSAINAGDTYVSNVTLSDLDNSSTACDIYSDYSNLYANVKLDSTYSLSVTTGDCDGGAQYNRAVKVFVDWNHNGRFDDAGEEVLDKLMGPAATTSVNITVPSNAVLDSVRMRVVCSENNPVTACGTYPYGETEDYTLIVTSGPPNDDCAGAIALTCGTTISGSTLEAKAELNPLTCVTTLTAPGVWYKVQGNGESMTVSLCGGSDINFDSKLNVYSGTCGALVCVDGNDDFCGIHSESTWNSVMGDTYYILVQGANVGNFDITLNSSPASGVAAGGTTTFCDGGSVTLMADSSFHYQWLRDNNLLVNDTLRNLNAFLGGSYVVIATDNNNCKDTTTLPIDVQVDTLPNVTVTTSMPNFCIGDSSTLTTITGNSYQWYNSGTAISGATSSSLTVLAGGTYNVIVTDGNVCSDSASGGTAVVMNPLPSVTISSTDPLTFCDKDSAVLNASPSGTYQWYQNGVLISGATSSSYSATTAASFNVIVTDINNCIDSAAAATSTQTNPLPVVSVSASGPTTFCQGNLVTLTTISGSGYQWFKDGIAISGASASTYNATQAGSYNVEVTDGNSCTDSAANSISTVVNPLPVVSISNNGALTFCQDDSTILTASPSGTTYQWFQNGVAVGTGGQTYSVKTGGNYNVTVTDVNSCVDSASSGVSAVVNPLPVVGISISGDSVLCEPDSTVLTASSGNGYQWWQNGVLLGQDTLASLTVKTSGVYNVSVTDANACSDTAFAGKSITINALPVVTFDSVLDLCNTISSYALTEGMPSGGVYSGTAITGGNTFDPSTAGVGAHEITYTYTDPNTQCENIATRNVHVVNCVGIEEFGLIEASIFPNPTDRIINIALDRPVNEMSVVLLDITGKQLLNKAFKTVSGSEATQLDVSAIASGVYFIRVITEEGIMTQKIVVE